jgi:WD40 repeat protein
MSDPSLTEREQRLGEAIARFLQAVESGTLLDREAWLAGYPDLADDLRAFLTEHDRLAALGQPLRQWLAPQASEPARGLPATVSATGPVLTEPAASPPSGEREVPHPPGYEVMRELGRGGMGVVYLARQTALNRTVALKMILAGNHAGEDDLARFLGEAEMAAGLRHPNLVQVHECGRYQGLPFFSLEYVAGGSLAERLQDGPLPPTQAACVVEQVARAMAHAHDQGVVHRDLKPANVLLEPGGAPKVTDFGLARRVASGSGVTATGAVLGTPSYMAPEQAEGKGKQAGPTADVYALGAVLYECLTGRPPFRGPTPLDTLLQVVGNEPVPVRRLQPGVPRDLETICLKCLQKESGKRYATAEALAEDLRRFEAGEPIAARPVGALERGWRWCRRNPLVAALLGTVAATMLLAAVVSAGFAVQAEQARKKEAARAETEAQAKRDAERQKQDADEARRKAVQEKGKAQSEWRRAEQEKTTAQNERNRARTQLDLTRRNLMTAQLWRAASIMYRDPVQALDLLHDYSACPSDLRDFTWRWYVRCCQRDRLTLRLFGTVPVVAFSPDGKTLAAPFSAGGGQHLVKLWDAATGKERRTLRHADYAETLAFSPDGKTLVSGRGGTWDEKKGKHGNCTVKLWDVMTGEERVTLPGFAGYSVCVAFSPDGRTLVCGSAHAEPHLGGAIRLWDVASGSQRASVKVTGGVRSVAFSPDGKTLATSGAYWDRVEWKGEVRLWELKFGPGSLVVTERASLKSTTRHAISKNGFLAFSPDGKTLAWASIRSAAPGEVKLCDVARGQVKASLKGGGGPVAFSPDGLTLASGSLDNTVKLWDVASATERTAIKGHNGEIASVAFSPDGKSLAVAAGSQIKVWELVPGQARATLHGHPGAVFAVAFGPDGKTLASGGGFHDINGTYGEVKLWDMDTGQTRLTLQADGLVPCVALSPDGKTLAWGTVARGPKDGTVRLWDTATKRERASLVVNRSIGNGSVRALAFSPDSKTLAVACEFGSPGLKPGVNLWDVDTGKSKGTLPYTGYVEAVVFSPDSKKLALPCGDRGIQLWDAQGGTNLDTLKGDARGVVSLAFSPDGKTLASGTSHQEAEEWKGAVKLWDVAARRQKAVLKSHTPVWCVAFSPDGRILASGGGMLDGRGGTPVGCEVKLWEATTGRERATLVGHTSPVRSLMFSPDGNTLASAGGGWVGQQWVGEVKLWEGARGQPRAALKHRNISVVAFSPDGKTVASARNDIRLWDALTGQENAVLPGHLHGVTSLAFSPDGKVLVSSGQDRVVRFWDLTTGTEHAALKRPPGAGYLALSPDGKTLALPGYDRTVRLWDVGQGKERAVLRGHRARTGASSLVFSPDGKTLASTDDVEVILWEVSTAQQKAKIRGGGFVTFSPDGKTLAVVAGGRVVLRDTVTGKERISLTPADRQVAFSPSGKTLALVTARGFQSEVTLYDVATGKLRATWETLDGGPRLVAFSPDGKTLACTGGDGIQLWEVSPEK